MTSAASAYLSGAVVRSAPSVTLTGIGSTSRAMVPCIDDSSTFVKPGRNEVGARIRGKPRFNRAKYGLVAEILRSAPAASVQLARLHQAS